jgi:2',5'-phosphodiesterase
MALSVSSAIRVASYNVLSSHLSAPSHFSTYDPTHLDPSARLKKIQANLQSELDSKAIICLQEVSTTWAGALHPYFNKAGYHFITALYGNRFNGYMGVALAVPNARYEIVDVDITRVADTKRMPRAPKPTLFKQYLDKIVSFFLSIATSLKLYTPPFDMWDNALYRTNQMICARLLDKETGKVFVVGTYHMPCMFKFPSVMVTHCALSAQHIHRWAKQDPYIYTGDFNIKPHTSQYDLLTQGDLDEKVSYYTLLCSYLYISVINMYVMFVFQI